MNSLPDDELALRAYVGHLEYGTKNTILLAVEKLTVALRFPLVELFQEPEADQAKPKPLKAGRRKIR